MYTIFLHIRGAIVQIKKKLTVFTVCWFLAKKLPKLNIKAVHNLKTINLGIIITP